MKVFLHVMHIVGMISALLCGMANYYDGLNYTWHFVAFCWILSSYLANFHISTLEKKLGK